jgi:hypothetical protein
LRVRENAPLGNLFDGARHCSTSKEPLSSPSFVFVEKTTDSIAIKVVAAVIAVSVATIAATCGVGAALISKGFYLAGGLTCGVGLAIGLMGAAFAITSAYYAAAAASMYFASFGCGKCWSHGTISLNSLYVSRRL